MYLGTCTHIEGVTCNNCCPEGNCGHITAGICEKCRVKPPVTNQGQGPYDWNWNYTWPSWPYTVRVPQMEPPEVVKFFKSLEGKRVTWLDKDNDQKTYATFIGKSQDHMFVKEIEMEVIHYDEDGESVLGTDVHTITPATMIHISEVTWLHAVDMSDKK